MWKYFYYKYFNKRGYKKKIKQKKNVLLYCITKIYYINNYNSLINIFK